MKDTKRLIFTKQKDILSSAIILSSMIILSRFFGLIRYRTLATFFSKEELDLFFASFRLPDFAFEILITGALSAAFIPIFIKYQKDKKILNENISSIINFMMMGLFLFILVIFVGADFLIPAITPGFSPEQTKVIVSLSRVLLISQLPFLVLGNIFSGMAQANRIFIVTAVAPVLYNLGIIAGTIFFAKPFWLFGPVIGVTAGAVLFLLIQMPINLIIGFGYRLFAFKKAILKEFIGLFLPRVLSVLTTQIDLTIDLTLSSLIGPGSYTIFFFSQRLQLFPVGLFGMAYAQASLPYLSDLYRDNKLVEIRNIFVETILRLFFFVVPLSFFFIFARTPLVRLFFGGPKFDWEGTVLTAVTASYFAFSLPFHTIFYFITRSFYAIHDTRTPFLVNFFSVFLNTVLSLIFIFVLNLPVWSLAISFSIAISINVIMLTGFFYQKIGGFNLIKLFKNSSKIYFASFISSFFAYPLMKLTDGLIFDTSRTINVFFLLSLTFSLFILLYLFLAWLLNIEEIYILGALISKLKGLKKKVVEVYTDVG